MPKFQQYSYHDETPVVPASVKPEPETFSREYVSELRSENATYRTKAKDAATKSETAEATAKKATDDAAVKITEANTKANDRIIRAELKAVAISHGMVDLDGLKLADLTKIKLDDDGEVVGAEDLMKALKESKPYLFKEGKSSSSTEVPPKKKDDSKKGARDMTPEEWKAEKKKLGM